MPDTLMLMVSVETGEMTYMHTVDAAEAMGLEDYRPATKDEIEGDSMQKRAAMQRMRGGSTAVHPEMMSREERQRVRDEANALAEQQGARIVPVPVNDPVRMQRVSMEEQRAQTQQQSTQARQHAAQAASEQDRQRQEQARQAQEQAEQAAAEHAEATADQARQTQEHAGQARQRGTSGR